MWLHVLIKQWGEVYSNEVLCFSLLGSLGLVPAGA